MSSIIIKNVRILDPAEGIDRKGDIFIKDGLFSQPFEAQEDTTIISGEGLTAAPGLVDLHVHLRDPGQTEK